MPSRPDPAVARPRHGAAPGARARQSGGFALGMVVGLLVGLAVALAVALYVTKVPVPFMDRVPQRSAEQDATEQKRNKDWEPNAPLASKVPRPGGSARATKPRLSSLSDAMSSAIGWFWYSAKKADSPRSMRRFHACCIADSSSACLRAGQATRAPASMSAWCVR